MIFKNTVQVFNNENVSWMMLLHDISDLINSPHFTILQDSNTDNQYNRNLEYNIMEYNISSYNNINSFLSLNIHTWCIFMTEQSLWCTNTVLTWCILMTKGHPLLDNCNSLLGCQNDFTDSVGLFPYDPISPGLHLNNSYTHDYSNAQRLDWRDELPVLIFCSVLFP